MQPLLKLLLKQYLKENTLLIEGQKQMLLEKEVKFLENSLEK